MVQGISEVVIEPKLALPKTVYGIFAVIALLLSLAGCVISPRRIVDNTGTPTPTPTDTPTPTATPTATPTPTPAVTGGATAMSATSPEANGVPEFLFVANQQSSSLQGFRVATNGALIPLPGSPFQVGDKPRKLASAGESLIMAGASAVIVFAVDPTNGAVRQTDSVAASSADVVVDPVTRRVSSTANGETTTYRLVKGSLRTVSSAPVSTSAAIQNKALMLSPVARVPGLDPANSVVDATGNFAFMLNANTNEIDAFRITTDKNLTPLNPATYPVAKGSSSIALVAP